MDWTVFTILGLIWSLVHVPGVVPIGRDSSGVTIGKPSITLAEEKDYKRVQENVNGIEEEIKAADSTLLQRNSLGSNDYADVLKDIESKDNNVYSFTSANKGNSAEGKPDEDVLSPSTLEEKLYGELENQEAKNSGFHVEKDAFGREIFVGPMTQLNSNKNETFANQNQDIKSSNTSMHQKLTPQGKENLNSTNVSPPVEEQVLNDPLAKVSYLFNQEANQHKSPVAVTKATNNNGTSSEETYDRGPVRKPGSSLLPNAKGVTTIFDRMHNSTVPTLYPSESNQKSLNQSVPTTENLNNSTQGSANLQFSELIESVIKRLGDQGSKFVSMQLAKHPRVKNIWASAIAQTLIKQSDKISQLDNGTESKDSSNITSLEPHSTGVKVTNNLLKTKVNAESISKPSDGPIDSSRVLNQLKESTHATEIINQTSTSPLRETSKEENRLNNNTPVSTVHGATKVTSHDVQDNGSTKPGTQLETTNKNINQVTQKYYANGISYGTNNNQPLFVSKNFERLGSDHQGKASKQKVLDHGPLLTPVVNGFVSNNENTNRLGTRLNEENGYLSNSENITQVGAIHKATEKQSLDNKPILESNTNNFPSRAYSNHEIDAPFLFNNITKLDPSEAKYLQLDLISDPVAKEQFSVSDSSFTNQRQPQEEDNKEASYLEHQINDAGQIVGEVLPGINETVSEVDNGEASYVADQLLDNPFAKTELAESFARDRNLINEQKRQNAKRLASAINRNSNNQHQQHLYSVAAQLASNEGANMETISNLSSSLLSSLFSDSDDTKMESDLEHQMLLSPKTVSDISAVDLAPMRNLVRFNHLNNMNNPKPTFMYGMQNEGNDQTELMNGGGGNEENVMTPYDANPLPVTVAQVQKKQQIEIKQREYPSKHKKVKHRRKINAKLSSSLSVSRSPTTFKHGKKSPSHDHLAIKPTKSLNQPGTRESEISPTSVIFGLTANEMKELEKHLAHGSHTLDDAGKPGSLKRVSPDTVAYYDEKTVEEQEKKKEGSVGYLMNKMLQRRKSNTKDKTPSNDNHARKILHKRKHVKPSRHLSHGLSSVRKYKKTNYDINFRRDLEFPETHTDVINSDLDQIRDLNPNAQEEYSKMIMKDYEGQRRYVKGLESFPFDERDPSYAFERSLIDQTRLGSKVASGSKNFQGHRLLDIKRRHHKLGKVTNKNEQLGKKSEFSYGSQFNDAKMSKPIIMKGNKILNGDVTPLDDVRHLDVQGLILETLRKESEGDMQYANALQQHDVDRMKSMFQSAGDEIGIKRETGAHRNQSDKTSFSNARKFSEKRDLGDSTTEFSDGTFRSSDFEKQLSSALMKENEHELTYVNAVQNVDEHGLNTIMHRPDESIGSRTILQNRLTSGSPYPKNNKEKFRLLTSALQNNNGHGSLDGANNDYHKNNHEKLRLLTSALQKYKEHVSPYGADNDYPKNNQEKLRLFFKKSNRKNDGVVEQKEVAEKKGRTTYNFKEGVFRDLTPEGKVLSSDYKELGNFGSDDQNQLASVLQSVNNGDQEYLKELEKIDSDDEKDLESLFRPNGGSLKRSLEERPVIQKEGTIETIADISEPESKVRKETHIVVSDDSKNEANLAWSAWSKCSKSCGNGSTKTRSRYCHETSPSDTFIKCPGWNHQTVPCDVPKNCPINGGFTQWTEWSACSETCGPKAVRMRMRLCTKPAPDYGGKDCPGWRFQVEYCKSKGCPMKPDVPARVNKKVVPEIETSKTNKQIIFKTLSATPVIEQMANILPSTSTDRETNSGENTLSRYSGLANVQQQMGPLQSRQSLQSLQLRQSLLNMQQQENLQQMPSSPNVLGFQQFPGASPGLNFFTSSLRDPNIPHTQSISSMQFLKPEFGSMPHRERETYENGGKTIHVQAYNSIGFTPWSKWTDCSASCGLGIRTRARSCISNYNGMGVDHSCLGPKVQTRRCRIQRCPIDGQFTLWSDWSACSKSCGSDSYRKRERTCTDPPPRYGGEDCEGRFVERQHCLKSPCRPKLDVYNQTSKVFLQVVNSRNASSNSTDGFTEWGPWSQCSRTCGSNLLRVRKRSCYNPDNQNCTGSTSEVKPCILPQCPENGLGFSEKAGLNKTSSRNISVKNEFDWRPWSACSKTCGADSYRTREKTCSLSLMGNNSKLCIGSNIQKVLCNVPLCAKTQTAGRPNDILQQGSVMNKSLPHPPMSGSLVQTSSILASLTAHPTSMPSKVPSNSSAPANVASTVPSNSSYSDWSVWSKCSATCGPKAVMSRERTCKLKSGCQELDIQTKPCQFVKCPVNGGLTGWTAWSACTKTCHTNTVSIRERYCTNPPPQANGKECAGQRMQARPCASHKCPVDGGVSEWSAWSPCRRCGKRKRTRTRKCNNPPPANGGKLCVEPLVQVKKCPVKHCKSTLGFSSWSSFSRCSRSCDGGIKKRRRKCRRPSFGCYGRWVQRRRCNERRCADGNYLVRKDPIELCGYHPCKVAKCVTSPVAMCVSNSKCKPVFFNTAGRIIQACKDDAVVLSVPPEQVCRFNPCERSACFTSEAERCAVSYNCKPIFFGADGERAHCRGILTVPAKSVCGFDPCFEKACKVDFTARCVTDADCKPTFITKTERILEECVEDSDDDESKDDSDDEENDKEIADSDVEDVSKKDSADDDDDDDNGDHDNYDDEDDDEKVSHYHRHKKRKSHRERLEEEDGDDDEEDVVSKHDVPRIKETSNAKDKGNDDNEDAVSKHDVPRINKTSNAKDKGDDDENDNVIREHNDSSESRQNEKTPVLDLNEQLFHDGTVSGMGTKISFVSKHGPAKFYWVKPGNKGSKNSTQLLIIEAKGSRKSSVLFPRRKDKLKPAWKPSALFAVRKGRLKPNRKSQIQPNSNGTTHLS